MACNLTRGFTLDCKDNFGGIEEVKIKVIPSSSTISANYTLTSGVVTIASGSQSGWYTYELPKNTSNFTLGQTSSDENGTNVYAEEVKIILNKFSAAVLNEMKLLAQNRLQVAVKTRNGDYWLFGYKIGLSLSSSSMSGVAFADRSGHELTFKGEEQQPTPNMASATYTSLYAQ